jgi:uncharacterized protein (TIGR02453 family)
MKDILSFLKNLQDNNTKEWFEANKATYLQNKNHFDDVVNSLIKEIRKFDKSIEPELEAKHCVFRIYKDVRFSKDKSPYKTNMGASINAGGKKSAKAGYYIHVENNKNFLAGGIYMPMPDVLAKIRQEIDYNGKTFIKILDSKNFKQFFKGIDEMDKLKNPPKGYDKDHPLIEVLKNKHFTVSHPLSNKEITSSNFEKTVVDGFKAMKPFLDFLNTVHT